MNAGGKMVGPVLGKGNGNLLTPAGNSVPKVCSPALHPVFPKSKASFKTTPLMVK